ncbi:MULTISPECIES: transketolase C-terminal domain-containing protein [unclassified Devosia]|uniref:transketolase family protein n=1 Tax=unclassified Devosia TaxID=196773 RepID=UPI000869E479|nr:MULTISPECIES: transketolase C-terminal domain-containing protein [unclassified Devosia]ODS97347.1 MAG: transketolase [Devosia sp. SCN 66-27]OJX22988.1 MAG: transketolase [Devosia sp. 66-14]
MSRAMEAGRTLAMGENEAAGGGRQSVDAPFGKALARLGQERENIVGLTADLGKYTDIHPFRDAYPERFFNVGMAEQNLVAVAAGLARTGKQPFATTYGVFASRRAFDFVAIALAHSNLDVKLVAGLPGLTTGYGGTHQAIEDLALMRMIPGLTIIDPMDATEIDAATVAMSDHRGPVYMRLLRGAVPVVLEPGYRFEIGKARQLRDGKDVGIISTGLMSERAVDAAALLEKRGISVAVLHVPTIKPFDAETVAAFAASVGQLVTAENHVVVGGLASLVVETLFDAGIVRKVTRIGLPDRYIECGAVPTLQQKYGLTVEAVVERIVGLQ